MKDTRLNYVTSKYMQDHCDTTGMSLALARALLGLYLRAEARILSFLLHHPELSIDDIQVVSLPSGEMYPQWKWAASLLERGNHV